MIVLWMSLMNNEKEEVIRSMWLLRNQGLIKALIEITFITRIIIQDLVSIFLKAIQWLLLKQNLINLIMGFREKVKLIRGIFMFFKMEIFRRKSSHLRLIKYKDLLMIRKSQQWVQALMKLMRLSRTSLDSRRDRRLRWQHCKIYREEWKLIVIGLD